MRVTLTLQGALNNGVHPTQISDPLIESLDGFEFDARRV